MVVCVFLSSTAPPPACMAKEGDNKTFAVIRGIISQSFSDLRTNPEVKQPQREQLPRWFPMKTIRQQIYRGVIVCNQVAQAQSACMSMCVPGLHCTHACKWWGSEWNKAQGLLSEAALEINTSCILWREEVLPSLSPYRWIYRQRRGRKAGEEEKELEGGQAGYTKGED